MAIPSGYLARLSARVRKARHMHQVIHCIIALNERREPPLSMRWR